MTFQESEIREMVRRVLLRTLGPDGVVDFGPPSNPSSTPETTSVSRGDNRRPLVTESDVLAVPPGGQLRLSTGAIVTPLAREAATQRQVSLLTEPGPLLAQNTSPEKTIALGADHGGFAMKEDLKAHLQAKGYNVVDCGTNSTAAVDYPDFAYAVAALVAEGRAWRGIVVDGAGIGSCITANKVPGVRAAMCYDLSTARNSREHNDANVLTLGGRLIGPDLARQIVEVWLSTEFGGDRHARRVNKIMGVEKRFLKK